MNQQQNILNSIQKNKKALKKNLRAGKKKMLGHLPPSIWHHMVPRSNRPEADLTVPKEPKGFCGN